MPVTMFEDGDKLSFRLIVTHLKAGGCYDAAAFKRKLHRFRRYEAASFSALY